MRTVEILTLLGLGGLALYIASKNAQASQSPALDTSNAPIDANAPQNITVAPPDQIYFDPFGGDWSGLLNALVTPSSGASIIGADNMTRGERNNNPGNIRYNPSINWQGQISNDGSFVIFDSPQSGIRALAKLLFNYSMRGLDTITEIISTYAPASENDTNAYIAAVSVSTGYAPDYPLNLSDQGTLQNLVSAIIQHENGRVSYDASTIASGVQAAFA